MNVLYYCGVDKFTLLSPHKVSKLPEIVDEDVRHLESSLDFVVYCKNSAPFTWFLKGFKIEDPVEIFSDVLEIDQVQICKSVIYAFSTLQNALYKVSPQFRGNILDELTDITPVPPLSLEIKLLQIAANDNALFRLDDNSGIYKEEKLLFRMERAVKLVKIACGFDHVLMLSDTGAVYSYGNGSRGELGHPHIVMRSDRPMRIEFFDDLLCTITDIACGGWHSLTLTSDGDVYSFGWNPVGQLGHSSAHLSSVVQDPHPVDLGSCSNPIVGITAGARHSVALMQNGDIYGWGWNKYGQLGTGDNVDRTSPTLIQPSLTGKPYKVTASRWGTFVYSQAQPST